VSGATGSDPPGRPVERAARGGLVAKGALYTVLGTLAARLAAGDTGADASQHGAMRSVADGPFGRVLLTVLAVGLLAYAGWRGVQAVRPPTGSSLPGWLLRTAMLARAAVYTAFALLAGATVLGVTVGRDGERTVTAALLSVPGGVVVVVAVGAVIVAVGIVQLREAWTADFLEELSLPSPGWRRVLALVGRAGHLARSAVFAVSGGFLVRAALRDDPDDAVGLDAALQEVVEGPGGTALLGAIAAGLVLYGGFCLLQARFARPREVD
jgi:hypothetical protein